MYSSPFPAEIVSTGAVAGRVHESAHVVVCVADSAIREQLLRVAGEVAVLDVASTTDRAVSWLLREPASLVIIDEQTLPCANGLDTGTRNLRELAAAVATNAGGTQLLILSASSSLATLPSVLRSEDLTSRVTVLNPLGLTSDALRTLLTLTIRQANLLTERQNARPQSPSHSLRDVLGCNPNMEQLYDAVREAALSDTPVLLCGEHGTGTSLIGNAIHDGGTRAAQPFVRVHCRSLTADWLNELLCADVGEPEGKPEGESEGESEGEPEAITLPIDAPTKPLGGTLFLDDIDTFPVSLHKPLCRFIERQQELVEG
ncbi:MAG TPA: sigma 54-interacting transcriptional regulator, partial [Planctomycetaceae bacterium]|nr:sigma 54-interacting transcriptional regulator [Planctomycetaceae bacterium]